MSDHPDAPAQTDADADAEGCGDCAGELPDAPDVADLPDVDGCGNGTPEDGEECDDGNDDDGDACLSDCTAARCGDGVVQEGVEECDDGNRSYEDGCLRDCKLATCGDGWVNAGVETCDRRVAPETTCADIGFPAGEPVCTESCEVSYVTCSRHLDSVRYGGALLDDFSQQLIEIRLTAAGGHVVAGRFQGMFLLGDVELRSRDARSVAVARLSRAGQVLWAHAIADGRRPFNAEQVFGGIAVGPDDTTVVVGAAEDWVRVAAGRDEREVRDETDVFVAKYGEDGAVLWDRLFGGFGRQRAESVTIGADGTIYLAGRYTGVLDFGETRLSTPDVFDVYVAALDPDGNALWGRAFPGTYQPKLVATPQGVVLVGYYEDAVDLGDGNPLEAPRWQQTFVAGLARDGGATVWRTVIAEEGNTSPNSVEVFPDGDVLVGGSFTGANRERGMFFARLRGERVSWQRVFRGDGQRVVSMAAAVPDLLGGFAAVGHFDGNLDLEEAGLAGIGSVDVFVAGFDAAGTPRWATAYGNLLDQYASDAVVDGDGNLRIVGTFEGAVDFGGGTFHSNGRLDSYILQLHGGAGDSGEERR